MRKLKGKAFGVLIMTYLCMFFICQQDAFADRKIYVGDIISINISGNTYTEEQLREKFKEFDIVNVENVDGGYTLEIRTFEVGKKSVNLGNKEIVIEVYSTLDDIDEKFINEGDSSRDAEFINIYGLFFFGTLIVFLVSSIISIIRWLKKRGEIEPSNINKFESAMKQVKFEDFQAPTIMTLIFKKYLEERYSCIIMGKTSSEVINEIKGIEGLEKYLDSISNWFDKCDQMKYCRVEATSEEVVVLFNEIYRLVQNIEYRKGVVAV